MMAHKYNQLLFEADKWLNFLKSLAAGLRVQIVLVLPDGRDFQAMVNCSSCQSPVPQLTTTDKNIALANDGDNLKEFKTASGLPVVALPLQEGACVVLYDYLINGEAEGLSLLERAVIAHELLHSFLNCFNESSRGGQRAIELSFLRKMNHIVLALFQGDESAASRAFDLILSAVIILLDAQGSWLELEQGASAKLFVKGDEEAVALYLEKQAGQAEVIEIFSIGEQRGRLGVLAPVDSNQAVAFLPLMAQECSIIIEIDHLFKLLHNQLARVLGAVGSAVLLVDSRGNISYANKAAEGLFEQPVLSLVGSPIASFSGPWTAFMQKGVKKHGGEKMDPYWQHDGRKWVDWQVSPLLEEEKLEGWVILADDRTDYYRWQEVARQSERISITGTMVGSLAHELRNPLSAAKGMLQLMGRKREPEKVRSYADLILQELDRVTKLLNEFLLLGRPADIASEPLDLAVFLQELVPLLEGEAVVTGGELTMDIEMVPLIQADPGQLTQVVLNLCRNAIEAVEENGQVVISLQLEGDWVALSVQDNGSGLKPEIMDKLFQPFFTNKKRGTGLGLPVVQAIVHNHGGQIIADNAPGGGAVFTVLLPVNLDRGDTSREDVMVLLEDRTIRYPVEQALRTAGLRWLQQLNWQTPCKRGRKNLQE